jgi:hypothetical protein
LTIQDLISQQLFVIPELLSTLFTAQWSNDSFFTDRLIFAVLIKKPAAAAAALITLVLLAAVLYGLIRLMLRPDAGARVRKALAPLLLGVAGAVVVTQLVILGASQNTIPFGHSYTIDTTDALVRQPAEDTWFQSSYARPVTKIDLTSYLIYSFTVPQGDAVAMVSVYARDGRQFDYIMRAGIDTAEFSYLRTKAIYDIPHTIEKTAIVREELTRAFSGALYSGITCVAQFQLPEPLTIRKIRVRCIKDNAQLVITDIFLRDF